MMCHMREGRILAEKYLIRMLGSLILAWETWFWNSDILIQRRRVYSVFLEDHLLGGKPSDSSGGDVSLFKVFIEFHDKVWVHSQGHYSSCINSIFMEHNSPGEGRPFGHIGQDKCDFFIIVVVDIFIYQ